MKTIKIWNDEPTERQLQETAAFMEAGELAVIPTDTLYAIACDALNVKAIERLCKLKRINPEKSNLSIICSDIAMAAEYSRIDNKVFRLMRDETPGPYTFLLPSASSLPKAFKRRKTVGVRIPDNNFALGLSRVLGHPLLVTSIEYEDDDYATNPELIAENYEGKVEIMVDGGDGSTEPSTIIDCTGAEPMIVRS